MRAASDKNEELISLLEHDFMRQENREVLDRFLRFESVQPETATTSQLSKIFPFLEVLLCTQSPNLRKKALNILLAYFLHNHWSLNEYKDLYKVLPASRVIVINYSALTAYLKSVEANPGGAKAAAQKAKIQILNLKRSMEKVKQKFIDSNVEDIFGLAEPGVTEVRDIDNNFLNYQLMPDPIQHLYLICDLRENEMLMDINKIATLPGKKEHATETQSKKIVTSPSAGPYGSMRDSTNVSRMKSPGSDLRASVGGNVSNASFTKDTAQVRPNHFHPGSVGSIQKTLDMLRQRLSVSPNRALETMQKINQSSGNPSLNNSQSFNTYDVTGQRLVSNQVGRYEDNDFTPPITTLRTDRSVKKYGTSNSPTPTSNRVSTGNSSLYLGNRGVSNSSSSRASSNPRGTLFSGTTLGQRNSGSSIEKALVESRKQTSHNIYMPKEHQKPIQQGYLAGGMQRKGIAGLITSNPKPAGGVQQAPERQTMLVSPSATRTLGHSSPPPSAALQHGMHTQPSSSKRVTTIQVPTPVSSQRSAAGSRPGSFLGAPGLNGQSPIEKRASLTSGLVGVGGSTSTSHSKTVGMVTKSLKK